MNRKANQRCYSSKDISRKRASVSFGFCFASMDDKAMVMWEDFSPSLRTMGRFELENQINYPP